MYSVFDILCMGRTKLYIFDGWNNTYKLFIYGNNGWTPLSSSGEGGSNIQTEFIEEIPNIIINK